MFVASSGSYRVLDTVISRYSQPCAIHIFYDCVGIEERKPLKNIGPALETRQSHTIEYRVSQQKVLRYCEILGRGIEWVYRCVTRGQDKMSQIKQWEWQMHIAMCNIVNITILSSAFCTYPTRTIVPSNCNYVCFSLVHPSVIMYALVYPITL